MIIVIIIGLVIELLCKVQFISTIITVQVKGQNMKCSFYVYDIMNAIKKIAGRAWIHRVVWFYHSFLNLIVKDRL